MEIITKTLYWISTGLMIPIIILLLIFFVRALLLIGTFYATYVQKLKFDKSFNKVVDTLSPENVQAHIEEQSSQAKTLLSFYLKQIMEGRQNTLFREKKINDFEIACQKDLAGSQTLAKLGPVLGLMGTLIPMGPALVGLAAGDIASMASNMQVAFSTTVVGLLVGAVGFVVMQVKRRWYAADINHLEYIVELLNKGQRQRHHRQGRNSKGRQNTSVNKSKVES